MIRHSDAIPPVVVLDQGRVEPVNEQRVPDVVGVRVAHRHGHGVGVSWGRSVTRDAQISGEIDESSLAVEY